MNPSFETNLAVWVVLANVFVWGVSITFGFVWDDHPSIQHHASLHDASVLWKAFTHDFWGLHDQPAISGYYRPWVTVSTAMVGWVTGFSAWGFHGLSLLLHILNCLWVVSIFRRMGLRSFWLGVGALLFSLHPLNAEPIGFASALPDLWCALFGLMMVRYSLEEPTWPRVWWMTLSFAGALLSKESAIVLIPVCTILARVQGTSWRALAKPFVGWFGVVAMIALARLHWVGSQPTPWATARVFVFEGPKMFFAYLGTLILPLGTSPVRPNPAAIQVFAGLGLFLLFYLFRVGSRRAIFAILGIWIFLWIPYSGLVELRGVWADRYFYGLTIIFAFAVARVLQGRFDNPRTRRFGLAWIVLWAGWAFWSILPWRSDATLWAHALKVRPDSSTVQSQNGILRLEAGDPEAAEGFFRTALTLDGADQDARGNLMVALLREKKYPEAQVEAERMRGLNPTDPRGFDFGATALAAQGHFDEARALQLESIRLAPRDWRFRYNAALMESMQGNAGTALKGFEESLGLAITPNVKVTILRACVSTAMAAAFWKEAKGCLDRWKILEPNDETVNAELDRVHRILKLMEEPL